jgi:hypothetical protein
MVESLKSRNLPVFNDTQSTFRPLKAKRNNRQEVTLDGKCVRVKTLMHMDSYLKTLVSDLTLVSDFRKCDAGRK